MSAREHYPVIRPRGRAVASVRDRRAVRGVLAPASWLYRAGAAAARRRGERARGATPARVTVVSVGNIEVGGTGKTPFCIHTLARLAERGTRAAYVSRAFASPAGRYPGVTIVPPHGEVVGAAGVTPGTRTLRRDDPTLVADVGDEAALVAAALPDTPLVLSRDKARAVTVAAQLVGEGAVVIDDGFQSWRVPRDVDIVLLDARRPFGDGSLLPAGTLREDPHALARADQIVFTGVDASAEVGVLAQRVRDRVATDAAFVGVRRVTTLAPPAGETGVRPDGPVAAVSAVGRPEGFEEGLVGCGVEIAVAMRWPDHHAYDTHDARRILDGAAAHGANAVVTTGKDWVKLAAVAGSMVERVWVARLALEWLGPGDPLPR